MPIGRKLFRFGNRQKNLKAASSKTAKSESRLTLTYKTVNSNVVVQKRLEEAKIEFFRNASYMSDLFEFSNYK